MGTKQSCYVEASSVHIVNGMKMSQRVAWILVSILFIGDFAQADEFPLTSDSVRHDDVPRGQVREHDWKSDIFPDTERKYWVYLPAKYAVASAEERARLPRPCVMVFQDGFQYVNEIGPTGRVPVVFDNLIHKEEIPPIVGVFINPGVVRGTEDNPRQRSNRSFEYDTLSDQYARMVIEEILPEVAKTQPLTEDADCRAIAGISSGGICAFTAAWQRPDFFTKVMSHCGSFTDIRGGYVYPTLIRKTKPVKPIRVFLQSGEKDLDNQHGSWPLANKEMAAALAFAGYDYQFVFGSGGHDLRHAAAIMPDSLRWLWRNVRLGE